MKKAKSRIKKKVTIKTVIIASLIVSSLWSAVFYLLTKPEPIPELLIIEKIEIKESATAIINIQILRVTFIFFLRTI